MNIAFVSSEVFPFAKTGGLADVSGALPKELANLKNDVKVFMPLYKSIDKEKYKLEFIWSIDEINIKILEEKYKVEVYLSRLPNSNVEIYFVDCPHFFYRDEFYTKDKDEADRWILFNRAVLEIIQRIKWKPDIINANDWQSGLIPFYLKTHYKWDELFNNTKTVFSVHNIGYQGLFTKNTLAKAEIDNYFFYPEGPLEFYGKVSFLKAGLTLSDIVTTVSPSYVKELMTKDLGGGMHDVLKERKDKFYGILNGVDYEIWNPSKDKLIPYNYNKSNLENKLKNKKYLLEKVGLKYNRKIPVIGMVSRMVSQKGFDILKDAVRDLAKVNVYWIILGSGDKKYESAVRKISKIYPNNFKAIVGYNNEMAHLIEAGADMFLMPSLYEPCGLNQIYSLKYGTVPIVRYTGGLADTVKDVNFLNETKEIAGTGFVFKEYKSSALIKAVQNAVSTFKNKKVWEKIMKNGMSADFSWQHSAKKYLEVYKKALKI